MKEEMLLIGPDQDGMIPIQKIYDHLRMKDQDE